MFGLKCLSFGALLIALLAWPSFANAGSCINWPLIMTQYELDRLPTGKSVIVQPFTDYTKKGGDDWLVFGLRDFLADLLKSAKDLRVLAGPTALYGAQGGPPDYTIGGSFKHMPNMLMVFIKLSNGNTGQLIKQYEVAISYPENKEFFIKLASAESQIMKDIDAKYDNKALKSVRDATSSTRAYENYAKGRHLFDSFNIGQADLAATWFTQSKKMDYRSVLGYDGMIDLLTFQGFYNKQQGAPFNSYYQMAEGEMIQMARLARPDPLILPHKNTKVLQKKKGKPLEVQNRFLASNIAFEEGLHDAQAGKSSKAAEALRRALNLVPEDAITWYHLARIEAKLGHAGKSQEAMQEALKINPCIQNP